MRPVATAMIAIVSRWICGSGFRQQRLRQRTGLSLRWPVLLQLHQHVPTSIVVRQLRLQKRRQISDTVRFRIFDIFHAPKYVLAGLLVFGLLRTEFFLDPEILFLGSLHFGERGIVGETAGLELLPSGLHMFSEMRRRMVSVNGIYLVFLHLREGSLNAFEPA